MWELAFVDNSLEKPTPAPTSTGWEAFICSNRVVWAGEKRDYVNQEKEGIIARDDPCFNLPPPSTVPGTAVQYSKIKPRTEYITREPIHRYVHLFVLSVPDKKLTNTWSRTSSQRGYPLLHLCIGEVHFYPH